MNSSNHFNSTRAGIILGILAAVLLVGAPGRSLGQEDEAPVAADQLVWPKPPEKPRVRWLAQYSKFNDVEKKKKKGKSWFARLAGVDEKEQDQKLLKPFGITADSRGRIYVTDQFLGAVVVLDPANRRVDTWGGSNKVPLRLPLGIATDAQDRVFVADADYAHVLCLTPEGDLVAQFGRDHLVRPAGIAVDKKRNRLYVADGKGHQVAIFDTETFEFIDRLGSGKPSGVPGEFNFPTQVAVDTRGFVYITDTFNRRIQIFSRRGRFVRTVGEAGDGFGQLSRPKGVAVDSQGHIYVADAEFNNFQIFDQQGHILLFVGNKGWNPGEFILITGLYIDENDRIYTAEQYTSRVQVFEFIPQPESAGGKEVMQPQE